MNPLATSKLSLTFDVNAIEGKTMSLLIVNGDNHWQWDQLPVGEMEWSCDITFPTTVSLIFGNKPENGTKVDENGNIIEDMSVIVKTVSLDNMPCNEYWLEWGLVTESNNPTEDIVIGKYIGTNGQVNLSFNEPNAFFWLAKTCIK